MTRILIVEDDPMLGVFYSRSLQRAGFTVALQARGDDGLNAALSERYEVAVLDWNLPALNGLQIMAAIRAAGLALRVLMLSGSGEEARRAALAAGADAFLAKPCGLDELNGAVASLLATGATKCTA